MAAMTAKICIDCVEHTARTGAVCLKLHTTSSRVALLKQVADLARGTFGFVQLAQDLLSGEHVAIKVCLSLRVPASERSGSMPAMSAGVC